MTMVMQAPRVNALQRDGRPAVQDMEFAARAALVRMLRICDNESTFSKALRLRLTGVSYRKIGKIVGVSGQRVQQMLSPDRGMKAVIQKRAAGACETCRKMIGSRGHIHHLATDVSTPDAYNAVSNLQLLCHSCHRTVHADPALAEKRRPRTPEEKAINGRLRGAKIAATRLNITVDEYQAHREHGDLWCGFHKAWEPSVLFTPGSQRRCAEGNRLLVRSYQTPEKARAYYARNSERLRAYNREWSKRKRQQVDPSEAVQ